MTTRPRILVELEYDRAAEKYLRSLTLENIMEAPPQATQRKITLESLDLVNARRSDFQVFNELLIQYPNPGKSKKRPQQVVPDNMVVVWPTPLKIERSYNVPLQPCGPFWVMEYVSKTNSRKDYDQNMVKYEHELKVPFYLLFAPEAQELTLYRHDGTKYHSVKPNENERYAIPDVEMEVALLEGWVRYWHRGELLPLPAELQHDLETATQRAKQEAARADQEAARADQEAARADQEAARATAAEAETERLRRLIADLEARQRGDSGRG